ncbi:MAG: hypothetical protein OEV43_09725 [Coriobacteriia bacterium]|nr:hypothetical protein [Coriobacteriia bacterium]
MRRRSVAYALAALVLVSATAIVVWLSVLRQEPLAPQAQVVQDLLQLRKERSQDASAYAQYLQSDELAVQLAESARIESQDATGPPVPDWETPYVSEEAPASADVVVVWVEPGSYPDWPRATVFVTVLVDGTWVISDAEAIEGTQTVPPKP